MNGWIRETKAFLELGKYINKNKNTKPFLVPETVFQEDSKYSMPK